MVDRRDRSRVKRGDARTYKTRRRDFQWAENAFVSRAYRFETGRGLIAYRERNCIKHVSCVYTTQRDRIPRAFNAPAYTRTSTSTLFHRKIGDTDFLVSRYIFSPIEIWPIRATRSFNFYVKSFPFSFLPVLEREARPAETKPRVIGKRE